MTDGTRPKFIDEKGQHHYVDGFSLYRSCFHNEIDNVKILIKELLTNKKTPSTIGTCIEAAVVNKNMEILLELYKFGNMTRMAMEHACYHGIPSMVRSIAKLGSYDTAGMVDRVLCGRSKYIKPNPTGEIILDLISQGAKFSNLRFHNIEQCKIDEIEKLLRLGVPYGDELSKYGLDKDTSIDDFVSFFIVKGVDDL